MHGTITGKVPARDAIELPHNLSAEQSFLGAMMAHEDCAMAGCTMLEPDDFYEGAHSEIFTRCQEIALQGKHPTPIRLHPFFNGREVIPGRSFFSYFATIIANCPSYIALPGYAELIREAAKRRRVIFMARDLEEYAAKPEEPIDSTLEAALSEIDQVMHGGQARRKSRFHVGEVSNAIASDLETGTVAAQGFTWGLSDLDRKTGGIRRQELVIVAARPSMGKTAMAGSCMRMAARKGHGVLFVSLEMSARAIVERMLSDAAWNSDNPLSYRDIQHGQIDAIQRERIHSAAQKLASLPMIIEDMGLMSLDMLRGAIRRARKELEAKGGGLDIVCIDYLQLLKASDRYRGNRVQEVTEFSAGLKAIAKDMDVGVVALSQLSRQVESRNDKRPTLSDLRDSGSIEQDADTVIFLYRDAYYLKEKQRGKQLSEEELNRLIDCEKALEIIVAKQRNGPIGTVKVYIDLAANAVRDLWSHMR